MLSGGGRTQVTGAMPLATWCRNTATVERSPSSAARQRSSLGLSRETSLDSGVGAGDFEAHLALTLTDVNVGAFSPPAMTLPTLAELQLCKAAGWVLAYPLTA